jgi:holliday junction DNA helicase RuvA
MIAGLQGNLQAVGANYAIINVHGISFQVFMPASMLSTLGLNGDMVTVHTHLHVREDNISLFGFTTAAELGLFETLISVSGVGPKLAMGMLSAMSVPRLIAAISGGDSAELTGIPGIGKKTAERLILELKGKLAEWSGIPEEGLAPENTDVLAALTSLGYSVREAGRAVAALPADKKLSVEEKLKLALQSFGGKQ